MKKQISKVIVGILTVSLMCSCLVACKKSDDDSKDDNKKAEASVQEKIEVKSGSTVAEKSETVYVIADATGTPQSITVSDWLKNPENYATLEDASDLKDLVNMKGSETYTDSNGKLTWKAEGSDIFYQGTSEKQLPVSVKFTYYLDGAEIAPKELAGKSGNLVIKVDYTNNTFKQYDINNKKVEACVPFLAISGMILNNDVFSNVTISNGKLIQTANSYIAVGFGLPGLDKIKSCKQCALIPSGFEIKATVKNFAMEMTLSAFMNPSLEKFDLSKVANGESTIGELLGGIGKLSTGANSLTENINLLVNGVASLDSNGKLLVEGFGSLVSATTKINAGIDTINGGLSQLSAGVDVMYKSITDGMADAQGKIVQLKTAQAQLKAGGSDLSNVQYEQLGQLEGSYKALETIKLSMDEKKLTDSVKQLSTGASTLATSMKEYVAGMDKLNTNLTAYSEGVTTLAAKSKLLAAGSKELSDGVNQLYSTITEKLTSLNIDFTGLTDELGAMKKASAEYCVYSKLADNQVGSSKFVVKTQEIK